MLMFLDALTTRGTSYSTCLTAAKHANKPITVNYYTVTARMLAHNSNCDVFQILDHIFTHMGVDTEGKVDHPIVMTETILNPNFSRNCKSPLSISSEICVLNRCYFIFQ